MFTLYVSGNISLGPQAQVVFTEDQEVQGYGNMMTKVVPNTLRPLPWAGPSGTSVGQVLCECFEQHEGHLTPHGACTRTLARQQIEQLQQEFGLRLYSSFECEFLLLDKKILEPIFPTIDLFNHLKLSEYENFLCGMESQLCKAGADIEAFQLEYAPGLFECAMVPCYGVEALDQYFRLKNGVKEMSMKEGMVATFMTRPFFTPGCANAGHYNHSLWNTDGSNAFYDASGRDKMSATFQHWLAGLLKHSPAVATSKLATSANLNRHYKLPVTSSVSYTYAYAVNV